MLPPAVILAGGRASRMGGGDKGRLVVAGRPILAHIIERLDGQVSTIALNANGDPRRFRDLGLKVLGDSVADHPGPLAGVLAGLDFAVGEGAEAIVTVAADTPFFPLDLVERLERAAREAGAPVALAGTEDAAGRRGRHPTFGFWSTTVREGLRRALSGGARKVAAFADCQGAATAVFPSGPFDPFFNINTPADLAVANEIASAVRAST